MLFSDFLILTGIEPSQKEIRENFKADLRKIISDLLFYIENNS